MSLWNSFESIILYSLLSSLFTLCIQKHDIIYALYVFTFYLCFLCIVYCFPNIVHNIWINKTESYPFNFGGIDWMGNVRVITYPC